MSGLVSVVVTTFNRNVYLKETIASIVSQTYNDIELIVIDDGSELSYAAENREICKQFSKCNYFYKKNTGQPDSRNYGIMRSKGAFIGFCDDDDVWVLDKLEKQLKIFELHPEYSIVTGCIEYLYESGERTGKLKCHDGYNHGYIFENLLIKNRTASITPLLKREVFEKVGLFNPNFTIAEDWEFWRRLSYYYEFYSTNDVLAYVRLHPGNMTKTRTDKPHENFELYRKLTNCLLEWGEDRFNEADYKLIYSKEWVYYRKIMGNHCPGIYNKVKFIKRVFINDFHEGVHLINLMLRNHFLRWK